jgi:hypothetical protein
VGHGIEVIADGNLVCADERCFKRVEGKTSTSGKGVSLLHTCKRSLDAYLHIVLSGLDPYCSTRQRVTETRVPAKAAKWKLKARNRTRTHPKSHTVLCSVLPLLKAKAGQRLITYAIGVALAVFCEPDNASGDNSDAGV